MLPLSSAISVILLSLLSPPLPFSLLSFLSPFFLFCYFFVPSFGHINSFSISF